MPLAWLGNKTTESCLLVDIAYSVQLSPERFLFGLQLDGISSGTKVVLKKPGLFWFKHLRVFLLWIRSLTAVKVLAHARNLQLAPCHELVILGFLTRDIKPIFLTCAFSKGKHFSYIQVIFSSFIYGKFWKKYFSFWEFFSLPEFQQKDISKYNHFFFLIFQWKYKWYLNPSRVLNLNSPKCGDHLLNVQGKRKLLRVWPDRLVN